MLYLDTDTPSVCVEGYISVGVFVSVCMCLGVQSTIRKYR